MTNTSNPSLNPPSEDLPDLPDDPQLARGTPYRHYKRGDYVVMGVGRLEADLTPVVIYESIHDPSLIWVRDVAIFKESVQTADGEVPRFAIDWPMALRCLDFLPHQTVLQVLAMYDAPYRRYHDRRHVLEMFELAHARGIALSPAQALAVLFHDAVYVPGCEHNELASATLIETMVSEVDSTTIQLAKQIVLDTRTHDASVTEAAIVLDLDLYRLATDVDVFDAHGRAVFEENQALLANRTGLSGAALFQAYMERRVSFLSELAKRPRLFLTPEFADCEAPARRNILAIVPAD